MLSDIGMLKSKKSLVKFLASNLGLTVILIVLLVPTFWRMLRPGIFSTHDFHVFRQYEFNKCIKDLQIPCRWAPDATYEYGQPMFNFYGQLSYISGQIPIWLGFEVMDGVKFSFILSFILSAIGMYYLSKKIWQDRSSAFLSALVYLYAPYRAVDVWVRGALPEAMSFIFFPLITLFLINFLETSKKFWLILFSASFAGLIITHNLSALMYSIFLLALGFYYIFIQKKFKLIPYLLISGVLTVVLAAYYLLPVVFEAKYISIEDTTGGYYNFEHHYLSIKQLLLSTKWGYGGSTYGDDDGFNLSVGFIQWILPLLSLVLILKNKKAKDNKIFFLLLSMGWLMLLLTHAKSRLIWHLFSPLVYIQFPWRFLGMATFIFALVSGSVMLHFSEKIKKGVLVAVILFLIAINGRFFTEDIWYTWNEEQYFSGTNYKTQISSSLTDYWPNHSTDVPGDYAPKSVLFEEGVGEEELKGKSSNKISAKVKVLSDQAKISLPTVYFPGWIIFKDGEAVKTYPSGKYGLISTTLEKGEYNIEARFTNTPVRFWGNWISLLSFILLTFLLWRFRKDK